MSARLLKWQLWEICCAQSSSNYFDHGLLLDSGQISFKVLQTLLFKGNFWCFQNYLLLFCTCFPKFEQYLYQEWLTKNPHSLEFWRYLVSKVELFVHIASQCFQFWGQLLIFFNPMSFLLQFLLSKCIVFMLFFHEEWSIEN